MGNLILPSPIEIAEMLSAALKPRWTIWKFQDEEHRRYAADYPDDVGLDMFAFDKVEFPGNVLLNTGAQAIWDRLCGFAAPTLFDNTNAQLGVGDNNTAENPTHTALLASTNILFKGMNTSYPVKSGTGNNTCNWQSDFAGSEANYAWNEFGVKAGSLTFNRKVSAQGTKTTGQLWTLQLSVGP